MSDRYMFTRVDETSGQSTDEISVEELTLPGTPTLPEGLYETARVGPASPVLVRIRAGSAPQTKLWSWDFTRSEGALNSGAGVILSLTGADVTVSPQTGLRFGGGARDIRTGIQLSGSLGLSLNHRLPDDYDGTAPMVFIGSSSGTPVVIQIENGEFQLLVSGSVVASIPVLTTAGTLLDLGLDYDASTRRVTFYGQGQTEDASTFVLAQALPTSSVMQIGATGASQKPLRGDLFELILRDRPAGDELHREWAESRPQVEAQAPNWMPAGATFGEDPERPGHLVWSNGPTEQTLEDNALYVGELEPTPANQATIDDLVRRQPPSGKTSDGFPPIKSGKKAYAQWQRRSETNFNQVIARATLPAITIGASLPPVLSLPDTYAVPLGTQRTINLLDFITSGAVVPGQPGHSIAVTFDGQAVAEGSSGVLRDSINHNAQGTIAVEVTVTNPQGTTTDTMNIVVAEIAGAPTQTGTHLTADGIRINFSGTEVYGFLPGGHAFVEAPATVTGWSPAYGNHPSGAKDHNGTVRKVNGAMLNPAADTNRSGFDSIHKNQSGASNAEQSDPKYRAELNVGTQLPITLQAGDSLIIAKSDYDDKDQKNSIEKFVILEAVATPPAADALALPYTWTSGKMNQKMRVRESDIRWDRLLSLPVVGDAPSGFSPDRRVIDFNMNYNRDHLQSSGHPEVYGRNVAAESGIRWLWCNSAVKSVEQRKPLTVEMVQRGVDRYGIFKSHKSRGGNGWMSDGGHQLGRKADIVIAGYLLGNSDMMNVVQQTEWKPGWSNIKRGSGFHEDEMTLYVDQNMVDLTAQGYHKNGWTPHYGSSRGYDNYRPQMAQGHRTPEWHGGDKKQSVNAAFAHLYRRGNNHISHHGAVLVMLGMGLKNAWGNDAFFDYHFREVFIKKDGIDPWQYQKGDKPSDWTGSKRYADVYKQDDTYDGWMRYFDRWPYDMLLAHYRDFYKFPWQS